MSDKFKNILIGLFVLMGITITIFIILFLQPSIGDGKKNLKVRFSNIAGINLGTRVTFAGKPIGEVEQIATLKDARKDKKDKFGNIYYYQLSLKVDSSVEIYSSDIIAIQTTGLMGERSIGIIPQAVHDKDHIITNDVIYAKSVDSFESTAQQIAQLSDKTEKAVDTLNAWFEKNEKNLSLSLSSISNLLTDLDAQKTVTHLNKVINSFQNNMNHVDKAFKAIEDGNGFNNLNTLLDNLNSTSRFIYSDGKEISKNLKNLSSSINDNLYLKVNAILSKANTLFNDINHYGLLFQYSKGWQRTRTQRANILQTLNSPEDFKNYFEKEIADITSSLGRLNALVLKAKNKSQKRKITHSQSFKRNFSYLLKQVESLLDIIKLYNEELTDKSSAQ